MKYLVILKRFEIWLLLAVVGFLLVYAGTHSEPPTPSEANGPGGTASPGEARPGEGTEEGGANGRPGSEPAEKRLRVESADVEPTRGGWIVEVTLLGRSKTGKPAPLDESHLAARTESGAAVPHFFEPFRPAAELSPDETNLATVRLWLESPAEAIRLEFQGESVNAELSAP